MCRRNRPRHDLGGAPSDRASQRPGLPPAAAFPWKAHHLSGRGTTGVLEKGPSNLRENRHVFAGKARFFTPCWRRLCSHRRPVPGFPARSELHRCASLGAKAAWGPRGQVEMIAVRLDCRPCGSNEPGHLRLEAVYGTWPDRLSLGVPRRLRIRPSHPPLPHAPGLRHCCGLPVIPGIVRPEFVGFRGASPRPTDLFTGERRAPSARHGTAGSLSKLAGLRRMKAYGPKESPGPGSECPCSTSSGAALSRGALAWSGQASGIGMRPRVRRTCRKPAFARGESALRAVVIGQNRAWSEKRPHGFARFVGVPEGPWTRWALEARLPSGCDPFQG